MSSAEIREKHNTYLWPATILYYKEPLVIAEGKGCRIKNPEGQEFLDFFGGILTTSIGYCVEEINQAIHAQVDKLLHTSTLYPSIPMVEMAEKLASICPGDLKSSYFSSAGTDADETAVMIAQLHTGRQEVIALRHCYSGRSFFAQTMTAHAPWRCVTTQLPFIKHAHAPYCYRCDFGLKYPECDMQCAKDLDMLIRTTTTGQIAAFIAEPIQGVGGFIVPPLDYFKVAVPIIKQYGGLFISDEVQTGFGRTGTNMWGIQHYGVTPDIMTMAKGIANGMPLGACVTTREIASSLKKLSISTFGGNPVACAAGIATVDYILNHELLTHATEMGKILSDGLMVLQKSFPKIVGDVRGMGLMQAIELVVDETAGDRTPNSAATLALFEATKERGLLIGKGGLFGNSIRISPPMTCTRSEIDEALKILEQSLAAVAAAQEA
jgi:4-aminobutyrate aminotransferase-like enzyme